jgi:hypothetical protein
MSDERLILKFIEGTQAHIPKEWQMVLHDPSGRLRDMMDFIVTLSASANDLLDPADDPIFQHDLDTVRVVW